MKQVIFLSFYIFIFLNTSAAQEVGKVESWKGSIELILFVLQSDSLFSHHSDSSEFKTVIGRLDKKGKFKTTREEVVLVPQIVAVEINEEIFKFGNFFTEPNDSFSCLYKTYNGVKFFLLTITNGKTGKDVAQYEYCFGNRKRIAWLSFFSTKKYALGPNVYHKSSYVNKMVHWKPFGMYSWAYGYVTGEKKKKKKK